MPGFELSADCRAPVEEVWKLLFDPDRFLSWWAGIEAVHADAPAQFTLWVTVTAPESEARRLSGQRPLIEESIRRLTALAEAAS